MINFDEIPIELKSVPNWVLWRTEGKNGKPTKVPYQPSGFRANTTRKSTWSHFETVKGALEKDMTRWSGIGFVLEPPYVGVDCDNCIIDGKVEPDVEAVLNRLRSYSEISPSGNGIHIILRGMVPQGRKSEKFEIYQQHRYFTITGNRLPEMPETVEERPNELLEIYNELFPRGECGANSKARTTEDSNLAAPISPAMSSSHELILKLERHGNDIVVIGPTNTYNASLARAPQNQVYFDLLAKAAGNEYTPSVNTLKVLTTELYMINAINEGCLRKDRDALERFKSSTMRFKNVIADRPAD